MIYCLIFSLCLFMLLQKTAKNKIKNAEKYLDNSQITLAKKLFVEVGKWTILVRPFFWVFLIIGFFVFHDHFHIIFLSSLASLFIMQMVYYCQIKIKLSFQVRWTPNLGQLYDAVKL